MKFPTIAAVDAALKRAADKHYRVLVVNTPPGVGVVTELTSRAATDGFDVMDLDDVGSFAYDVESALARISSFKNEESLLVLCVIGRPTPAVQEIVAHASAEFGSAVGHASLNSLFLLAAKENMAVRPAAILAKTKLVTAPIVAKSGVCTP